MDWTELESACGACRKCALHTTRNHVVVGGGNPRSPIVFIGEGPGEQEDLTGLPFVGRAGKLLDDMLALIDMDRSMFYITNIVKCRPPGNRDPLNTEKEVCFPWLRQQVELIRPAVIVCLGRIAAMTLIKEDFKITQEHGKWFEKDGIRYMALYHPAALLRDPAKRPETFVDLKELQRVAAELGVYER